MPINIAYEYPANHKLRRFWRCLTKLVGVLLIVAGLLAAIPAMLVAILVVASLTTDLDAPDLSDSGGVLAGSTAIAVACLVVGMWLVKGRRRIVLFLRRFGFVGATQALTFALATAMGNSWRLATLDDARVAPVGVRRGARWVTLVGGVIAIGVVALLLNWVFGGGFEESLGDAMDRAADQENLAQGLVAALIVGIVFALIALAIVLIPAAFLGAGALLAWSSYWSVRRAEGAKAVAVMAEREIEPTARSVARRGRHFFSPRLVVVRVDSRYWQEVVLRLASESAAVIVDVSEPSDNLLWEIETLRPHFGARCILVGEEDSLRAMNATAANPSPIVQDLFHAVGNDPVFAYATDKGSRKRFAKALSARLGSL